MLTALWSVSVAETDGTLFTHGDTTVQLTLDWMTFQGLYWMYWMYPQGLYQAHWMKPQNLYKEQTNGNKNKENEEDDLLPD